MMLQQKMKQLIANIRFHLFETDDVFIYWPDFSKGILLLLFYLCIIPLHLLWYINNYHSENRIWFNESYYDERIFTTGLQYFLGVILLIITWMFKKYKKFRLFMGWFIPLFFGLSLMFSAQTIGVYTPSSIGGTLSILLIGFVFYKPKVIYSIALITSTIFFIWCYLIKIGVLPYAPLFSDQLNQSDLYKNTFWLKSMMILYIPILVVSALFFLLLINQWRRREKKIETLSQIDSLTQVYNRRYITDFIEKKLIKNDRTYAMVILDLDFFKKINDQYGHEAGDEVLRCVSHALKVTVRPQDLVGRLGGEEFILVLADLNFEQALEIAERCRGKIESLDIVIKDQQHIHVTASFGVALAELKMTMDEVSIRADRALYKSKEKGRNVVSHYLEANI